MKILEIGGLLAAVVALCSLSALPVGAGAQSPETELELLKQGLDDLKSDASRVRKQRDRASADLARVLDRVGRDLTGSTDYLKRGASSPDRIRNLIRHRLQRAGTGLSFTYPAEFFPENPRGGIEVERSGDEVRVVWVTPTEALAGDTATLLDLVEIQGTMLGRMRSDLIRTVEGLRANRTTLHRREDALRASAERVERLARENRALKERVADLESRLRKD